MNGSSGRWGVSHESFGFYDDSDVRQTCLEVMADMMERASYGPGPDREQETALNAWPGEYVRGNDSGLANFRVEGPYVTVDCYEETTRERDAQRLALERALLADPLFCDVLISTDDDPDGEVYFINIHIPFPQVRVVLPKLAEIVSDLRTA